MEFTRRRLIALMGAGIGAQACAALAPATPDASAPAASAVEDPLDTIASRIVSGGPAPDGIPPVERPAYLERREADKVWKDDVVVDALILGGVPRAYPRFITVWHEIVNETSDGEALSITYCPLTGSAVVFAGRLSDGRPTSFGTSGRLYNSNLVMYDRATKSLWPQLLGVAVTGERKGERLRELPLAVTTTYGRWKARYPDTLVLSTETGHLRAYGTWPYGDYDTSPQLLFPVAARDERFHSKKVVVGVRAGGDALAIAKVEFLARRVANVELGGTALVALADPGLAAVRVFRRETPRGAVRFAPSGDAVVDEETRSRWSAEGEAVAGELAGARLERVSAFDVQWFAWYAFYPKTSVLW